MLNEVLLKQITETSDLLGLQSVIIEKDYYVTSVINTLSQIEDENFELIFCGGTCLAKAHKIVQRMSEDIDFKIKFKHSQENISKSKFSKILRLFREKIAIKLKNLSLTIENLVSRNEGKYYKAELKYISVFSTHTILRPYILVEFTASDVRLATESLTVSTLIQETLHNLEAHDVYPVVCVSSIETAIEKFIALTRKVIAIERGYYHDDPSLIRHVYDLTAIYNKNIINHKFRDLAIPVLYTDIKQFKNQHSEFATDPASEIKNSLKILKENQLWFERYKHFIESMVFGTTIIPTYKESIEIIENISHHVLEQLNSENFELLLAENRLH